MVKMKTFKQFITERVTPSGVKDVENYADNKFHPMGVDVKFSKHSQERMNRKDNEGEITSKDLKRLYKLSHQKHGKRIANMKKDSEAVLQDVETDIHIPFTINPKSNSKNKKVDRDMIAKTVMKKKDFKTNSSSPKLPVGNKNTGLKRKDEKIVTIKGQKYKEWTVQGAVRREKV